jgi:hypothetical protein
LELKLDYLKIKPTEYLNSRQLPALAGRVTNFLIRGVLSLFSMNLDLKQLSLCFGQGKTAYLPALCNAHKLSEKVQFKTVLNSIGQS